MWTLFKKAKPAPPPAPQAVMPPAYPRVAPNRFGVELVGAPPARAGALHHLNAECARMEKERRVLHLDPIVRREDADWEVELGDRALAAQLATEKGRDALVRELARLGALVVMWLQDIGTRTDEQRTEQEAPHGVGSGTA